MGELRASHMPQLAQELVAYFDRQRLALDYMPASLAIVVTYLTNVRSGLRKAAAADPAGAEAEFDRNCQWIAAYLGEVIRRQAGGRWTDGNRVPLLKLGEPDVEPLAAAANLLAAGQASIAGTTVRSLAAYYETAIRLQLAWVERVVVGSHASLQALKDAIAQDRELATWLVVQCQLAVQTASLKWDAALDFSSGSLDAVERILGALHQASRSAAPDHGPSPAQLDAAIKVWGVYVGEVFRRHYGGRWTLENSALALAMDAAKAMPLSKVRKRIVDGPADNVVYYFKATSEVLAGRVV